MRIPIARYTAHGKVGKVTGVSSLHPAVKMTGSRPIPVGWASAYIQTSSSIKRCIPMSEVSADLNSKISEYKKLLENSQTRYHQLSEQREILGNRVMKRRGARVSNFLDSPELTKLHELSSACIQEEKNIVKLQKRIEELMLSGDQKSPFSLFKRLKNFFS